MGQILGRVRALTGGPCDDDVQCANRPSEHDQRGRGERPERPGRHDHPDRSICPAQASVVCLRDGDIRLLSGLEEVVAAMRRGADELERWGRCADMDRVEKVRRLGVLVGGLNQQLGAELTTAVAALADIEASKAGHPVHQCVPGLKSTT